MNPRYHLWFNIDRPIIFFHPRRFGNNFIKLKARSEIKNNRSMKAWITSGLDLILPPLLLNLMVVVIFKMSINNLFIILNLCNLLNNPSMLDLVLPSNRLLKILFRMFPRLPISTLDQVLLKWELLLFVMDSIANLLIWDRN